MFLVGLYIEELKNIEELQGMQRFADISDEEVDAIIRGYMSRHGETTGEPYISGMFRSKGTFIQRWRVYVLASIELILLIRHYDGDFSCTKLYIV